MKPIETDKKPTDELTDEVIRNSVAIRRLVAEVAAESSGAVPEPASGYNRVYSRHNRGA